MSNSCVKHPMTFGDHICSECGHYFCRECIVFPYGVAKPGLCIGCALERGGVRKRGTNWPKLSRRAIRDRVRSQVRVGGGTDSVDTDSHDEPDASVDELFADGDRLKQSPGAWSQTYE